MRSTFRGYYRPTEEEFSALWADCLFVLDANVMLGLYQLGGEASKKLDEILTEIANRDRLWVPHQAALEYQRRRRAVIETEARRYKSVVESLERTRRKLKELPEARGDLLGQIDVLVDSMEPRFDELGEMAEDARQSCLRMLKADPIRDNLDELLDGKVGPEYEPKRLEEVYQEAERRYEGGIPPGYRNSKKEGVGQYGDVVLWFQILDQAKERRKGIILVTNERKDDWWLKDESGAIVAPRPELIQEVEAEAGVWFYMYGVDRFVELAGRYLGLEVTEGVIEEVREFVEREEKWETAERVRDQEETLATIRAAQLLLKDPSFGLRADYELPMSLLSEYMADEARAMDGALALAGKVAADQWNRELERIMESTRRLARISLGMIAGSEESMVAAVERTGDSGDSEDEVATAAKPPSDGESGEEAGD